MYDGYLIPGKSIVIGNAWAMLQDEMEYPDPKAFKPERFLKQGKIDASIRDPASIVFGFGRRYVSLDLSKRLVDLTWASICPGAHIAQAISWMQIATILSSFNISPATDKFGNAETPTMEYHNGITL